MFKHRFDQDADSWVIAHWFLLSFNGGCINAGGFLATGRFVSHVTGFATLFGVDITQNQIEAAFGILSVPIFFLLGSFLAGLMIDRQIYRGERPRFDWVMLLCALCLFVASGGESFDFGIFGETSLNQNYVLMAFLCLASGLQNGAITSSSGKSVRTTHLTGLTTDLGLGFARVLTISADKPLFKKEVRANYLRMGSIFSFVVGSAVGSWIFLKVGYEGFILSGVIAAYTAWHGRNTKVEAHALPSVDP